MRKMFVATMISLILRTATSGAQNKADAFPYAQLLLNPATESLASEYRGFDPAMVYRAIEALGPNRPKSAFDTTADYELRRAAFSTLTFLPGIPVSSQLSFVLNDPDAKVIPPAISFVYDTDTETLQLTVSPERRTFVLTPGIPVLSTLTLKSDVKRLDRYTGQNAYGATAEVNDILDEEYGIALNTRTWLDGARSVSPYASRGGYTGVSESPCSPRVHSYRTLDQPPR